MAQIAEERDAGRASIPFEEWYADGPRQQIPWKITLRDQFMRADLRLSAGFSVTVSARDLNRLGPQHELFLLARVGDEQGHWFPSFGLLTRTLDQPLPPNEEITLAMSFIARPGRYTLALVLYDRVTGLRSLASRPLHVEPIRNDPLPDLYRDLPDVEFPPPAAGLDRFLEPKVTSRLRLPLTSVPSPRVDVLINFGTSTLRSNSRSDNLRLWILARAVRLFSQLDAPPGFLRITGVDADSRRMLFVLDDMRKIPWDTVRDAVMSARSGVVNAAALAGRERNAWFFRETIHTLLAGAPGGAEPAGDAAGSPRAVPPNASAPRRVLIVISNPVDFASSADVRLPRAEDCH
ncbi:MAG TPA: hypothetical protein VIC04_07615, partial [Terriglobia bacterium]